MEPTDLPYGNLDQGIVPLKSKHWSVGCGHRGGANVAMADGSVQTLVFSQKPEDVTMLKRMTWLKEPMPALSAEIKDTL
jgi:prepilin-type processing-associated H-X9-DG protein